MSKQEAPIVCKTVKETWVEMSREDREYMIKSGLVRFQESSQQVGEAMND